MTVDNDIQSAIRTLYNDETSQFKKVNIFPNHSLKHFKKYKLNDRAVLSKVNSLDEILDLLSYNADVTCFSTNKLDKYFLKLLIEMHNMERKKYMDYIFCDYGKNKILSKDYYDNIKYNLDDATRYFFDEVYRYCINFNIPISKLVNTQKYPKKVYDMYVKNYLLGNYKDILKSNKMTYIRTSDVDLLDINLGEQYDFINLSYSLNNIDKEKFKKYLQREAKYINLLKENGKIQSFVSSKKFDIKNHTIYETRSFLDPYTNNENCKKEYAYMYRKSQ